MNCTLPAKFVKDTYMLLTPIFAHLHLKINTNECFAE